MDIFLTRVDWRVPPNAAISLQGARESEDTMTVILDNPRYNRTTDQLIYAEWAGLRWNEGVRTPGRQRIENFSGVITPDGAVYTSDEIAGITVRMLGGPDALHAVYLEKTGLNENP